MSGQVLDNLSLASFLGYCGWSLEEKEPTGCGIVVSPMIPSFLTC